MPLLEWNHVELVAKDLFNIWPKEKDYLWFKQNYDRFNWFYSTHHEFEKLKIQLCAIANVYYEFCHEAYEFYTILPDEIGEIFQDGHLPFNYFILGQLVGADFLADQQIETKPEEYEDYFLRSIVFKLTYRMKYQIFETLYSSKNFDHDTLFDTFSSIVPNSKADYSGLNYLVMWGETYSNSF